MKWSFTQLRNYNLICTGKEDPEGCLIGSIHLEQGCQLAVLESCMIEVWASAGANGQAHLVFGFIVKLNFCSVSKPQNYSMSIPLTAWSLLDLATLVRCDSD